MPQTEFQRQQQAADIAMRNFLDQVDIAKTEKNIPAKCDLLDRKVLPNLLSAINAYYAIAAMTRMAEETKSDHPRRI